MENRMINWKAVNSIMICIFLIGACGKDKSTNPDLESEAITIKYCYRNPDNLDEVLINLGEFSLDLGNAIDLNNIAYKTISFDSLRSIDFHTWDRTGKPIDPNAQVIILFTYPDRFYWADIIPAGLTHGYGLRFPSDDPIPYTLNVCAFFLEEFAPKPDSSIFLYIDSEWSTDSLLVDPSIHTIPKENYLRISNELFNSFQDSLVFSYTISTNKILGEEYIPVKGMYPTIFGRWDFWTLALYDATEIQENFQPHQYMSLKDYDAFIFVIKNQLNSSNPFFHRTAITEREFKNLQITKFNPFKQDQPNGNR